ncbi:Arc family DNA-binding protein [Acinetobacter baumannii]
MNNRDAGTQHKLRMPPELKQKIAESAKAYNRSMNADIVARLERSFELESDLSPLNMPPEELKRRLQNAKTELYSHKTTPNELNLIISPEGEDGENVVISKKFYSELMEIKDALRNLSLAVLNLEKHKYNLDDAVEEWKKDNL